MNWAQMLADEGAGEKPVQENENSICREMNDLAARVGRKRKIVCSAIDG
jgi:hypothetical protein